MKWILKIYIKKRWLFHKVFHKGLVKITMKKFFFFYFYWGLFLKSQNWAYLWVISLIRLLIQRYAQFQLFRKGPGNSFSIIFWVYFSRKMFLTLYSIHWPNFIVLLPLLLEILGDMCIAIVSFLGYDLINFVINLTFLIKPFFYMTKNSIGRILSTN